MTTYTKNLIAEYCTMGGTGWVRVPTGKGHATTTAAKDKTALVKHAKNVALFFAAPFVGLAYLLAFPFIAVGMLIWIGCRAAMENKKARTIALAAAAPVIALAFLTAGPVLGIGALAWAGGKALVAG